MKKLLTLGSAFAIAALCSMTLVRAASSTTYVVTPATPVFDSNHVVGVLMDGAPGFASGSVKSDGVAKTDMYFTPESNDIFGREITLGEIASMSYYTKKGTTHNVDLVDWALAIYTKPYAGDVSTPTWYGDRIGFEPYFAANMVDPANTWNQWASDDSVNRMKFYESTAGAPGATFGSYGDPDWDTLKASNALSGSPYANHKILYFSLQTGSATAAGFTGQLDGLHIVLTDGTEANVNLEAVLQPTTRDACKKDGWMNLKGANGTAFSNQGDCVSYVNTLR